MRLRYSCFLLSAATLSGIASPLWAQEEETSEPASESVESGQPSLAPGVYVKLDVSRRFLKNFLTDETALLPHKKPDGSVGDLPSVFMIGSTKANHALFWDPVSCRLIGILDVTRGETDDEGGSSDDSSYVFKASGLHPLSSSQGASGTPDYFGFRLVEGKPEFLYTFGGLVVAERIWLADGGRQLHQRLTIREPGAALSITIPEDWKQRVSSEGGSWKENKLSVEKKASVDGIVLIHQLVEPNPESETE